MCPCPVQGGTLMSPAAGSISGQRVSPEDSSRICSQSKKPLHIRSHTLPRGGRVDGGLTPSPQSKTIPALQSPTGLRRLCHNCITAQNLPLLRPASLISFRNCFWKCIPSKKSAHISKSQSVFSGDLTYTCWGGAVRRQIRNCLCGSWSTWSSVISLMAGPGVYAAGVPGTLHW